jgi:uncharacterized membrane protein (UPF0127 family)
MTSNARWSAFRKASLVVAFLIAGAIGFVALRGNGDPEVERGVQTVKIGDQYYHLEIAADEATRMKGLGQRTHLDDDGGMLFVFPAAQDPRGGGFVMRDCFIDIDIIYLDTGGRISNWHAMKKEKPREADGSEGNMGDMGGPEGSPAKKYEDRLKKYPSRFAYQYVIELKGGTIESKLKGKIKENDRIDLPLDRLKRAAK